MPHSLESFALFSGLPETDVSALANQGVTRTFPKNAVIVNENDRSDSLYIILSGKVKVYVSDENGHEIVLGVEGTGDYFGEMVLDEGPRSASVMTLEPSTFCIIPKEEFRQFLRQHPDFAIHLIQNLIKRARVLTENVKSLALLDVYGRVARLLLELATEQDGQLVVMEKLTQQDIANRVGASREMVSRILKDLVRGGYITVHGRQITIKQVLPRRW